MDKRSYSKIAQLFGTSFVLNGHDRTIIKINNMRALTPCSSNTLRIVLLAILSCAVLAAVPLGGYNLNNNRYSDDQYITKANVNTLRVKWRYTSNGDISATPAVVNVNGKDIAFFPDWYGLV